MKKLLAVLGLLLLVSMPTWAQIVTDEIAVGNSATGFYFVDYYSNNINPLAADQVIRASRRGWPHTWTARHDLRRYREMVSGSASRAARDRRQAA